MASVVALIALTVAVVGVCALVRWRWRPAGTRRLRRLTLAVRLSIIAALLLSLTPLTRTISPTAQTLVVVADRSGSTVAAKQVILDSITALNTAKPSGDMMAVVGFSNQAAIEAQPSQSLSFSGFSQTLSPDYTNIATGLASAGSVANGTDLRRHVVLLSDGRENVGDAAAAAAVLRGSQTRVDVVSVSGVSGPDARVDAVVAPYAIAPNTHAHVVVTLAANTSTTVSLGVTVDGVAVSSQAEALTAAGTSVDVTLAPLTPGRHNVSVQISGGADAIPQNDSGGAIINVIDTPHVLVVEGSPGDGSALSSALSAAGVVVTKVARLPADGLSGYQAVVLANVPASALATNSMNALDAAVKNDGVGLVVSGGANSFGPGGYQGQPIEKMLPVEMQVPERATTAPVGIVLVLESVEDPNADATIRAAAHAIVNELGPSDYFGIVTNDYSNGAPWAVPFQPVTSRTAITAAIDQNQDYGDPPVYGPGMQAAQQALDSHPTLRKQVIVLGDGDADATPSSLVSSMVHDGITVSAVGANIDNSPEEMATMQQIATVGGGKFYQTTNLGQVPDFLIKVATEHVRPWIIDGSFQPHQVASGDALTGIDVSAMPSLTGYVAAQPREASEVLLTSPADDPVLAQWHYGNGRVLAWMSDTAGKWSSDLLRWSESSRLLANMVASTLSVTADSNMALSAQAVGDHGHLVAVVNGSSNGTTVVATVQSSGTDPIETVTMQRTGANQFEADFPLSSATRYTIRADGSGPQYTGGAITGLVINYSPEYRYWGADDQSLAAIAAAGGGTVLTPAQAATIWSQQVPEVPQRTPLWPYLLALAAILIPLDIGLRMFGLSSGQRAAPSARSSGTFRRRRA